MNDNKDYIDLREGSGVENVGNGPPPVPSAPLYLPPARKNTGLIVAIAVIAGLIMFGFVITAVVGVVMFNRVTTEVHTSFVSEVAVAERVEIIEAWAERIEVDVEYWADGLEDRILDWVDGIVRFDGTGRTAHHVGERWAINTFWTFAEFYDTINIDLDASYNMHILLHDDHHIKLDTGDAVAMWVEADAATGIISVSCDELFSGSGAMLTIRVPYDWRGEINIFSAGNLDMGSDDWPEDIIIQRIQATTR